MGRGRIAKFGRRAGGTVVSFRLSDDEVALVAPDVQRAGCKLNELARRRLLGSTWNMSTELAKPSRGDLTVAYDEDARPNAAIGEE